jgi:hypothetical protein
MIDFLYNAIIIIIIIIIIVVVVVVVVGLTGPFLPWPPFQFLSSIRSR